MSTYDTPKKRHGFLKFVIVLLLVAVIGFGGWLGMSFKRVSDLFGQVSTAYTQMESSVEAQDYAAALTYARTAASLTSQASQELEGTQWDIAAMVPVVGTDVTTMRSIGDISGTLADDAVLPALDAWDELVADGIVSDGNVDMGKITQKVDQVVQLATTLQNAGKVVDDCSVRANNLPVSRFDKLNEWAGTLRGTVSSVDELFDQFGVVIDLVVGVADAFGSLSGLAG